MTPQTVIPQSRTNSIPTATFQFVLPMGAAPRSSSVALDYSGINRNTAACAAATVLPSCQDPWLFYAATYTVLQGEQERQTARAYLDFKLTDHIKAFGDFTYGRVDGIALFQPAFSNAVGGGTMPVSIRGDNAFLNGPGPLAAQLRTEWTAAGLPLTQTSVAQVGKFWTEFGRRDSEVLRKSYRAITGIEGGFDAFGRNVTYDAYAMYSELDGFTAAANVPNVRRTQQAADAITVGGQTVCRDVAARAAGCVPWDLVNGPSPDAVAWANGNARADGVASQQILATNFSTDLFELPAGPLGFAVGAEYRKEKSDQVQDALSASGALFYNAIGQTKGEYDITEGFTEIVVPILKDKPFAYRLSIEGAERVGNYSTVGNISQWRLGAQWAPVQDLRFRGSRSVAVRAPNITRPVRAAGTQLHHARQRPLRCCADRRDRGSAGQAREPYRELRGRHSQLRSGDVRFQFRHRAGPRSRCCRVATRTWRRNRRTPGPRGSSSRRAGSKASASRWITGASRSTTPSR